MRCKHTFMRRFLPFRFCCCCCHSESMVKTIINLFYILVFFFLLVSLKHNDIQIDSIGLNLLAWNSYRFPVVTLWNKHEQYLIKQNQRKKPRKINMKNKSQFTLFDNIVADRNGFHSKEWKIDLPILWNLIFSAKKKKS